jgi:hypothetical protein
MTTAQMNNFRGTMFPDELVLRNGTSRTNTEFIPMLDRVICRRVMAFTGSGIGLMMPGYALAPRENRLKGTLVFRSLSMENCPNAESTRSCCPD